MKRWLALFAALLFAVLYACAAETRNTAGLQLLIATDMAVPGEVDQVRIEVRQRTAPGQWGTPFVKELRVPTDIALPTSFAITAGKGDNNVQIRLVGKKNAQPVVLAVVETLVPSDRVATLQIVLARACGGQLVVDVNGGAQSSCANAAEACQAESGQCGPVVRDSTKLPDYREGDEDRVVVPVVDAGARDATVLPPIKSAAKDITRFTLAGVDGVISGREIRVVVPTGTVITNVAPIVESNGVAVSPASGAPRDFTDPVTYTVTAEDGSTRAYSVVVTVAASSAKEITQFQILGVNANVGAATVTLTLPSTADLTSLTPVFTITGVAVNPARGVAVNFSSPVVYTVQAADGTTRTYTVTVTRAASPAKEITRFNLSGAEGVMSGASVTVTVPSGTVVTSLVPGITHTGTAIDPPAGNARDFTSPVTYEVTAADGLKRTYLVTVSVAGSSAKEITSFAINGAQGVISAANISLVLPFGTNLSNLTPLIGMTGASIAPASGAPRSFNTPVVYTVTAADGTTKTFTVTASAAAGSAKDITSFSIQGSAGTIVDTTIAVTVPAGTIVTSLAPTVAFTGAFVTPASGVAKDFTSPVPYVVQAGDGSTKTYTVTVTVAASTQKDITSFRIDGVEGTFTGPNIVVTLPFNTNVTSLTPQIQITGASVSPQSGTPRDFTNAQTYTVTAADGSLKSYTASVVVAPSSEKEITRFEIQGHLGVITGSSIVVTMPAGTPVTSLMPVITITGQSVNPASGTARDFTSPVNYTVFAADGTSKLFVATVNVANNSQKDITSFSIDGYDGSITTQQPYQIYVNLPAGTDTSSLTPIIAHNGMSVNPPSGQANNFKGFAPIYTVTAGDGSTRQYTVYVSNTGSTDGGAGDGGTGGSAKEITSFTISGQTGSTITGSTIHVTMPPGSTVTSLTPAIVFTGQRVSPASGSAQDFTNPVQYTVTAFDGTQSFYQASVSVGSTLTCMPDTHRCVACECTNPPCADLGGCVEKCNGMGTAWVRQYACSSPPPSPPAPPREPCCNMP